MPYLFRAMFGGAVMLVALAPAVAEACSCSFVPPQELVDKADIVFVGTVVTSHGAGLYATERSMTFEVERVWKGAPAKQLKVVGYRCGPWNKFKVGERKIKFAHNGTHALIGDDCSSENYELVFRGRSTYDELLPGHETTSERELRLKQAAELEELCGRTRELIRAGAVLEAERLLSGSKDWLYFDHEGFRLWIDAYVAAERERRLSIANYHAGYLID